MTRYDHKGGAVPTTLVTAITEATLDNIIIDSAAGWPDGTLGPFFAVIDRGLANEEKILLGDRSGTTLTPLLRGADDTTGQSHSEGASIEHVFTALEADQANEHVEATDGVHGVAPGELIATETFVDQQIAASHPQDYAEDEATVAGSGDPSLATTNHSLPYPDGVDPLLVRRALELLALAIDDAIPFVLNGTSDPPEPASDYPEGTVYFRTQA